MDSHRDTDITDDLSALAWVQDELRRSLDAAHKALRRFLKEAEAQRGSDVDVVDPAVLRTARQQLHQGVGALELVGLPSAAVLLRASEAAVQRLAGRPQKVTPAAIESIEQASFALLDYLARRLAGRSVSPVAMFPQYRAVQELAGGDRVHPADLWAEDWRWCDLPADAAAAPRAADGATRAEIETLLLQLMRGGQPAAVARLSDVFAGLGEAASDAQTATLWRLAAGFFEAQSQGLLQPDNYTKRVGSRLLAQLRMMEHGESAVSERLALDLLFFCSQCSSPGDGRSAPRLAAVRQVYGLAHRAPVDYEMTRLGRFDPALIVQARRRVAAAKDAWSSVAGGEMHRLPGLAEQFALVADSLGRLYPSGALLAAEPPGLYAHLYECQHHQPDYPHDHTVNDQADQVERALRQAVGVPAPVADQHDRQRPDRPQRQLETPARIACRSALTPTPTEQIAEHITPPGSSMPDYRRFRIWIVFDLALRVLASY